jgi:hypothetical protein
MELLLSHHWKIRKSPRVSLLVDRLQHCLELGGSLPIEIPVYDWSSLLGCTDSWQGVNHLHDVFEELGINKDLSIAIANPEVIRTLGRTWYTTRRVLFVADTIDATDFREALLHWQHEQQLVK